MAQTVKNPPAMQETPVPSLFQEDPLEKGWQPTPVFLPGEFHGQGSLAGCRPWGLKELDTAELLSLHNIPLYICTTYSLSLCQSGLFVDIEKSLQPWN